MVQVLDDNDLDSNSSHQVTNDLRTFFNFMVDKTF